MSRGRCTYAPPQASAAALQQALPSQRLPCRRPFVDARGKRGQHGCHGGRWHGNGVLGTAAEAGFGAGA
eukprot:5697992-Alexandrium_andersonii.AAC.1